MTNVSRVVDRVLVNLRAARLAQPGRAWPTDAEAEEKVRQVLRDRANGVELVTHSAFGRHVAAFRNRSEGANLARLVAAELWGEVE